MHEIICPHCRKAFKIDEAGYADILQQVRDHAFEEQLQDRLALAEQDASLAKPIDGAPRYLKAELLHAVRAEGARSLADVMVRRTHLSIELPDGAVVQARGSGTVGGNVFFRDGVIEGGAPSLPVENITV